MNKILWVILSISLLFLVVILSGIWLLNAKTPGGASSNASAKLPVDDMENEYTSPGPVDAFEHTIDGVPLPGLEKMNDASSKGFYTEERRTYGEVPREDNDVPVSFKDPGTKTPQDTAVVKKETVTVKKTNPAPVKKITIPKDSRQKKAYYIQTGAFSHKSNADENNTILTQNGLGGRIVKGIKYYTVLIGPYSSKAEARKFLNWIREIKGMENSYITYK